MTGPARVVTDRGGAVRVEVGRRVELRDERSPISRATLFAICRATRERDDLVLPRRLIRRPRRDLTRLMVIAATIIGLVKGCTW